MLTKTMSVSETLNIYTQHRRDMVQYAYSIVRDDVQAEDLVQEAYIRFKTAMESDAITNPVAFLYNIVRNLSTDYLRAQKRRSEILDQAQKFVWWPGECDELSPERIYIARAEDDYMRAAIARLPARCRNVFYLYRFKEKSQKEIANTLSSTRKMVRNDLKIAIKAMTLARRCFNVEEH